MSMTDPIADMLTRIRNAQAARHEEVAIPASKVKREIARVLREYGYVSEVKDGPGPREFTIGLRYAKDGNPVIRGIRRVSRPGLRSYAAVDEIPMVLGGLGHTIVSTSRGIMSGRQARKAGVGGEVVCKVW
jgi:small subunit ribosomal protein S8